MPPPEDEASQRVYGGLRRAIMTLAPMGAIAPVAGSDAQAAAGIAVYRNNVRSAFLRALTETFPVTHRLVGHDFFRYLAHEYFHTRPPKSPLVARYGDALPEFLDAFEPAAQLPYLADVARLEIAWLAAYHAAESTPLSAGEVLAMLGENADRIRFTLHPSLRLVASAFPVHTIWAHNRSENPAPLALGAGGECALIVRPAQAVLTSVISRGVYEAMAAIAAGALLGDAIEKALSLAPDTALKDLIEGIAQSGAVTAATAINGN